MRRIISVMLASVLLAGALALSASANSAQRYWRGVDSAGAIVMDGDCPIEVKNEVLTLDLSELPQPYYNDIGSYLAYSGRVTAEYTFYNPTDMTVTATLVFPFGKHPDYASFRDPDTGEYMTDADVEKYGVTLNGEETEKRVRHTLKTDRGFNVTSDIARLSDVYASDSFYSPDTTVTRYTFVIGGKNKQGPIDETKYRAATVAFDWDGGDGDTVIYFPEQDGFHKQSNGDGRLGRWARNGDAFSVYAIGEPLSSPISWKCYEDGGVKNGEEIDGVVELTETVTMTFEELALEKWSEDTGVSKVDWYNAFLCTFSDRKVHNASYNYVNDEYGYHRSAEIFISHLMRWYEYEITLEADSTVTNTVTAPIYPAIDRAYTPPIYDYTYLLSPANTFADFGELLIVVNTPYFVTASSLDGFVKTEQGYTLTLDGLPKEELRLTLSTDEDPSTPTIGIPTPIGGRLPLAILICFAALILITAAVVPVILLVVRRRNRRDGKKR